MSRVDNRKFEFEQEQGSGRTVVRELIFSVCNDGKSSLCLASSTGTQGGAPESSWAEPANHKTAVDSLRGSLATINYLCCECCAATNPGYDEPAAATRCTVVPSFMGPAGTRRHAATIASRLSIHRLYLVPIRDRRNRANPIESHNRFAGNNNYDWIPRGSGGRTRCFFPSFVPSLPARFSPNHRCPS